MKNEDTKTATIVISKLLTTMRENERELKDVLAALLHIYKDKTFGDNVWRLMIEEKAQNLINQ